MRRTQEQAEKTSKEVLEAALSVFGRRGYAAATLAEIAVQAGVTRGAIYHHFASKAGLYAALVDDAFAQAQALARLAIDEGGTAVEVVSRLFIYHASLLEDDLQYRAAVLLTLSGFEGAPDTGHLQARRARDLTDLNDELAEFFRAGKERGSFRADLDPRAAARTLLALENGLAGLWLADTEAFSLKESIGAMVDVFLNGLV